MERVKAGGLQFLILSFQHEKKWIFSKPKQMRGSYQLLEPHLGLQKNVARMPNSEWYKSSAFLYTVAYLNHLSWPYFLLCKRKLV